MQWGQPRAAQPLQANAFVHAAAAFPVASTACPVGAASQFGRHAPQAVGGGGVRWRTGRARVAGATAAPQLPLQRGGAGAAKCARSDSGAAATAAAAAAASPTETGLTAVPGVAGACAPQ